MFFWGVRCFRFYLWSILDCYYAQVKPPNWARRSIPVPLNGPRLARCDWWRVDPKYVTPNACHKTGCFPPSIWHVIDQCVPDPIFLGWHIDNLSLQSEIFFGGCCMMCMAMRFFSWASSTQTLMLEMLETYRILVGWRAMVSRRRRKLKGSSQTSKLDDTSWELHWSTNAHSWTSEGCKQVWR